MNKLSRRIRERVIFLRDLLNFRRLQSADAVPIRALRPVYRDRDRKPGPLGAYFHQDLWAARLVAAARPARHVDVGSTIGGFVAHCLAFMNVEVVDIRPLAPAPAGLSFIQADAMLMTGFADGSVPSLSSLHAAEHFGLGRYGDPVDPEAHITFMRSLQRVLCPGGRLYFSVPVSDRERVEFNAHRVLHPDTVLAAFDALQLRSFALVKDDGRLYQPAEPSDVAGQHYACGLFEFAKPGATQPGPIEDDRAAGVE
jgi:SAM-dependent methyltransferase